MLPAKRRRFNSHPQFTPRQLFAAMQGAWLEPVLGNMWQENTGVTPVSAPTQTVGLLLDQSQGLLLGPELVSNGTFDANTTGWTVGGGSATISNPSGRLRISATVNGTTSLIATSALSTVIGCTYFVTVGYGAKTAINPYAVNLSNNSNGSGAHTNTSFDSISNTQLAFVATSSTTYIVLRADTSTSNVIGDYVEYDNISVRQVLGNHAYQATAVNRPTYQLDANNLPLIRHDTDDKLTVSLPAINVRRNLLTSTTGPFTNMTAGGWLYETGLPDPLGRPWATKISYGSGSGGILVPAGTVTDTTLTYSVVIKHVSGLTGWSIGLRNTTT